MFFGVCSLKKNIALQELYLCDNELNSFHDSMQLGELLKYNSTLRTLDLSNNAISDSGMPISLSQPWPTWILTSDFYAFITQLCYTEFPNTFLSHAAGLEELCDGLRVQKSGLRTLVLHNNQITHRGMIHLGRVLVSCSACSLRMLLCSTVCQLVWWSA